jgi:YjbE family integral membrane protein
VVLRILFATIATHMLTIVGLTLAGGILLLWVCWKMYREITLPAPAAHAFAGAMPGGGAPLAVQTMTFGAALMQIIVADVSMSLDNVLAVAGIARDHFWLLAFGLVLSVALMGVASTWIARLLDRHYWISWVGLGIITFVALRMIWDGSNEILKQTAALTLS